MPAPLIRDIVEDDLPALLKLNQAHVTELSHLTLPRMGELVDQAFLARCADTRGAFLLTFDQAADYDSPNFLWFREKFARFVYVDRIVVAPSARGQGLAGRLYKELFAEARRHGHSVIVCEVNSDPPNPGSDRFHEALGFVEAGQAHLADRGKSVRYLTCTL